MTERPTGRHRAAHKSTSSALSTLTGPLSVMGDYVGTVRRSGVIIAMSSGLMATMALPAHAVNSAPAEVGGPQTASIPAVPGGGSSAFFSAPEGGLLSMPEGLAVEDGTVAAPVAATLDFDRTAFVAVPTEDGVTVQPVTRDDAPAQTRRGGTELDDLGSANRTRPAPASRREARKAAQDGAAATGRTSTTTGKATAGKTSTKRTSSEGAGAAVSASANGSAAVAIASRYLGVPYRFGGSSPNGFDCSGLVQYVYRQLGKSLPRTAAEQAAATKRVPRSQARPGDLVLFPGGGHIGIYVGNGMMLDAPRTGKNVQIRKIYSSNVSFGRVV